MTGHEVDEEDYRRYEEGLRRRDERERASHWRYYESPRARRFAERFRSALPAPDAADEEREE